MNGRTSSIIISGNRYDKLISDSLILTISIYSIHVNIILYTIFSIK